MSQIKYGIVLSYVSLALNNVITILYTPFLLKYLGQSEYGLFSLVMSIIAYLTVLDLGLGNTIVRYTALYKKQGEINKLYSLFGTFISIYSLISLCLLILCFIIYFNLESILSNSLTESEIGKAKIMFILLSFNLFFTFPLSVFSAIVTAYQKFVFSKTLNIIRITLQPLIMIPLLLMGYKAITLVALITILNLGTLLLNTVYCFKKLKIKILFKRVEKSIIKEIFIFSFYIFLGVIVDKINWSTGQVILGINSGTATVAIYAISIQILLGFFSFASSISGVFLPRITELILNKNYQKELSDLFIKIGRIQYIILLFVLCSFIFYGKCFIKNWAGEEYLEAYGWTLIIMIPLMFTSIQHTGVLILQALNMQKFRSIVYIIIAFLNIILGFFLSKQYGGIGCSISFALALFLGNIIIMNIYFNRTIKINIKLFWKEILKSVPLIIIFSISEYFLTTYFPNQTLTNLCIQLIFAALIYLISAYYLYLNNYEKNYIRLLIKKINYGSRNINKA